MGLYIFDAHPRMNSGYSHPTGSKIELSQVGDEILRASALRACGIMPESGTKVKLRHECNPRVPGYIQHDIVKESGNIGDPPRAWQP